MDVLQSLRGCRPRPRGGPGPDAAGAALTWIGDERIATQDLRLESPDFELKGKGAAEFGGEKREWDIEGKRQKNDK